MINRSEYMKAYLKEYAKTHADIIKPYQKQYREKHRKQLYLYHKKYTKNNLKKAREYARNWYHKTKDVGGVYRRLQNKLLLVKYLWTIAGGFPTCLRCGASNIEVLQGDHINGGGNKELKRFVYTRNMFRYYVKHPKLARHKLQILCANCNLLKSKETR